MRKMAGVQTPTVEVKKTDDGYSIKTITTFKTSEMKFKLDEEFDELRMDGVTVKVLTSSAHFLLSEVFFCNCCSQEKEEVVEVYLDMDEV